MSAPHPLPEALARALAAYDRRRRRVLLWRGIGDAVVVGGLGLAGAAAVDLFAHPGLSARLAISVAVGGAALGALIVRGLVPALRPRPTVEVARAIERAAGGLHERLSSAVQLAEAGAQGVSAWMVNRTVALAALSAAGLDARALVDARPARRALVPAAAMLAALGGSCLLPGAPTLYARALWPWARLPRPARTHLVVEPGDRLVALGSGIAIAVSARPDPDEAEIDIEWQDGQRETAAMERDGSRWRWQLAALTRPFTYSVRAGDGESERFRVAVVPPPRVDRVRLRVTPPAYSGLPGRAVDGGDAEVVAGSVVALEAVLAGDPVASATVVGADGAELAAFVEPAQAGGPARAHAELRPAADLTYALKLVGASGFSSESAQRWLITVKPDAPPTVTLSAPGLAGGLVAPDESVPVLIEARDDLGLKRVELEVTREQESSTRIIAESTPSGTLAAAVDLRGWDPAPGDTLTVTAVATDVGGQAARSAPVTLTVAGAADAAAAAEARRLRALIAAIDAQGEPLAGQARTWAALARAGEGDDAVARRDGLALIEDRAAAWATALLAALETASATEPGSASAHDVELARIARELACWTRGEAEQARALARAAERAPALLADGGAVAEAAAQDLASFRHDLAALAARHEGDELAGRAEALVARATRASAILAADLAWRPNAWRPGLAASFFAGVELQGAPVLAEVALPAIADRDVPGVGTQNYSARWEGEVQVPEAGDWLVQAVADDGVRVAIDGKDLLGPQAWAMQAPTSYTGTARLEAGWHPIRVEYMQGGGGASLKVAMGHPGAEPVALGLDRLRCHVAAAPDAAVARAMAGLDPAAVDGARERFARSLADLAAAARGLAGFAEATPTDALKRLAQDGGAVADALTAIVGRRAAWSEQDLSGGAGSATAAAGAVRAARDQLAESVREIAGRRPALGAFPALRQALRRSHERLERIQHLPWDLPESDRRQAAARAMAATRSWFEQMRRDAPRARAGLLDGAQSGQADARTAVAAARASRVLGAVARQLDEALARIARIQDPHQEVGEIIQQWQRLDELLRQGAEREAEAHRLARADAARVALESAEAAKRAEAAGHPAEAAARMADVRAAAARLARAERAEDKEGSAAELERLAGLTPARADLAGLDAKLRQYDSQDRSWPADSSAETAAELAAAAQRLAQAPAEARAEARVDARLSARESALATAAEAERRREAPATRAQADGFAALAADLDRFAANGEEAPALAALAERAEAVSGVKGPLAQEAAAKASAAPASAPAERLERLASAAAEAADHADKRAAVGDELRALAGPEATPARDPAARAALAGALERFDAAATAEGEARRHFADLQDAAARAADELATQAAREAQAAAEPGTRATLGAAADPAARSAQAARELGARAGDQAVPTEDLAAAARAQAETVGEGIARPLAEGARAADPGAAEALARVGRQAAATAALERRAADEVERAQRRRVEARRELAQAVLAAGAPEAGAAGAAAEAQAAAAQRQADAALGEAEQRWREARARSDQAAAAPGDAGAAQQATQARQTAAEAQGRAGAALAEADQRRLAVTAALAGDDAKATALAAAQAVQAADAERGALRLAEAADALAPSDALAARALARPAANTGRASEAALRAAATGMADQAATPAEALAPTAPGAEPSAARAALAGIAAAPNDGRSYRAASRILADAAQTERLASATPAGSAQAAQGAKQGESSPTSGETHSGQGEAGDATGIADNPGGRDQAEWARLPEQEERRARAAGVERFSEEHQEAIRAYLRRLGDGK